MGKILKRFWIKNILITAMLSFAAIMSISFRPSEVEIASIENAKFLMPGWKLLGDISMDYDKYTALDPDSILFRNYKNNDGRIVNLAVVYHHNDRWGAHDPTLCYTSQGWKITDNKEIAQIVSSEKDFQIVRLKVKKGTIQNVVYYYWFSSGARFTASRNRQMVDMILNGVIHGFTESGFVRFSTTLSSEEDKDGINALNDFIEKFTEELKKKLK